MGSLRRHEGVLYIDQGIGPDMNRNGVTELPTFTCCHCDRVVVMNAQRTRPRGYCAKCDHWTCDNAVCASECNPIRRDVDLALAHPDSGQPFLLRGPRGEILFDPAYIDKERIF